LKLGKKLNRLIYKKSITFRNICSRSNRRNIFNRSSNNRSNNNRSSSLRLRSLRSLRSFTFLSTTGVADCSTTGVETGAVAETEACSASTVLVVLVLAILLYYTLINTF